MANFDIYVMADTGYVKIKDIKPVMAGYLRKTQLLIKKYDVPDEKAVHDIRVLLKKSRAVLKLIASQDESDLNVKDLKSLKMAGRLLSDLRDNSVQRKVLKDLRKTYTDIFVHLAGVDEINSLLNNASVGTVPSPELKEKLTGAAELLHKTAYRIRFRSMNAFDPQELIRELGTTFEKASASYLAARNQPSETTVHEFRKRSKDFLYQLYFFRPLNTQSVKSLEKKLNSLTTNLGRYNDLSQLINTLGYNHNDDNKTELDELIIHVREQQDIYLKKLWPGAFKIFCPGTNFLNLLGFKILLI
ncbi:MAG TPA: CHAD domain-containing protein [Bacteroidales bacterium]|nr:CHAD domain-containing protein [Bacteroidales bacterium]